MKTFSFVVALSLRAAALMQSGCAAMPKDLDIDASWSGKTLDLNVGDTMTLMLESNPSTGYLWVFASQYDEAALIMTGESYMKPEEDEGAHKRVGAPTKKKMTFKAVGPGHTGVKLEYRRPWEKDRPPAKTFELLVVVKGEAPENGLAPKDDAPRRDSKGRIVKDPSAL